MKDFTKPLDEVYARTNWTSGVNENRTARICVGARHIDRDFNKGYRGFFSFRLEHCTIIFLEAMGLLQFRPRQELVRVLILLIAEFDSMYVILYTSQKFEIDLTQLCKHSKDWERSEQPFPF